MRASTQNIFKKVITYRFSSNVVSTLSVDYILLETKIIDFKEYLTFVNAVL